MAIKFLDAIDLTGLEIQNVLLQSSAGTPSSNLGGGQIVYDSSAGTIKYYDAVNNAWVELDGQGGVTSIAAGNGLLASSSTGAITISPNYGASVNNLVLSATSQVGITVPLEDHILYSDSKQVVNFAAVSDLPFAPAGTVSGVTSVATGNSTFVSGSGGPITGTGTLTYSLSATGTPSSTTYLRGDNTWATIPAGFAGFNITDGKTPFSVASGNTVEFTSSTSTIAPDTSTALAVDLNLVASGVTAGSYTSANITVDQYGRVTAASAGGAGTMTSWKLASDGGTTQTVSNNDTVTISGGTALTGVASATDTVTINHDNFGTAGTYAYPTSVTTNAQGHITAITAGSAPGTMSAFKVAGDSGSSQSIGNNDTLSIVGAQGIGTVASATDTLTINLELCDLKAVDIQNPAVDTLVGCIAGANGAVTISSISLSAFGVPTAALSMGTQKITNVVDPTAAQDAATKNYVDTTFAGSGALIYQGGYDATQTPPSTGVKQGWTYAVTTAGNASGFWNPTLEIGDLIIANKDNPASAADWTEINKNIDVATATVQGIANFPTAGGLSVSSGAVSMANVITATSKGGSSKSLSATVDAKGRVTAISDQSIQIAASQVTNFCTEVVSCQTAREKTGTIGNATTWTITHNFNTRNVMVQVYSNTSPYDNVEVKITRPNTNDVTITVAKNPGASALNYMIQKIG